MEIIYVKKNLISKFSVFGFSIMILSTDVPNIRFGAE